VVLELKTTPSSSSSSSASGTRLFFRLDDDALPRISLHHQYKRFVKKEKKKVKQKADHLVKKNKRMIPREDAKIAKKKKFDAHIVLNFLVVQCIV